jgi:hypothetical protein
VRLADRPRNANLVLPEHAWARALAREANCARRAGLGGAANARLKAPAERKPLVRPGAELPRPRAAPPEHRVAQMVEAEQVARQ